MVGRCGLEPLPEGPELQSGWRIRTPFPSRGGPPRIRTETVMLLRHPPPANWARGPRDSVGLAERGGIEPQAVKGPSRLAGGASALLVHAPIWRRAEESNPAPFGVRPSFRD